MDWWGAGLALSILASVLLHPAWSPIDPAVYVAPYPPPLEGPFARNDKLTAARRHFTGEVRGPEDVLSDSEGNLYCSNADGTIRKLWTNGSVTIWANVGGHPLGIEWVEKGAAMVVCESQQGLLLACANGSVEVLSTASEGVEFRLTDNADVSSDKQIYFSDASSKFHLEEYMLDVLEARPHGRLLRYDPESKTTETLLSDLYFANGVALSKNEDFVLITETPRYRIRRLYLKGPKAGTSDMFWSNLPGLPDNINLGEDGLFWVALVAKRDRMLDFVHKLPMVKALMARLPTSVWRHLPGSAAAVAFAENGSVVHFLADFDGLEVQKMTSVRRIGNRLVLGSLEGSAVHILEMS